MRPPLHGILETALYFSDLAYAIEFYDRIFGFVKLTEGPRVCAYDVAPKQVLLLFQEGASIDGIKFDSQFIPGHNGVGPVHFAFAIAMADFEAWQTYLTEMGIEITGDVTWNRGGRILYFNDPEGHVIELATPGVWASY